MDQEANTPKKYKRSIASTEPYKGVRDFYPEDMRIQRHIFEVMSKVPESFGYEEYSASILEPSELYESKTSDEIVSEQTYTFTDRGDRRVTLRPEMTPSIARLVAARRRELAFPLRWYSIPNVFRYERPQKGRLREHWQLNCDIFGVETIEAEIEILMVANSILKNFGAPEGSYEIRLNHRGLLQILFEDVLNLEEGDRASLARLIDRKDKMESDTFNDEAFAILGDRTQAFLKVMSSKSLEEFTSSAHAFIDAEGASELQTIIKRLHAVGIQHVRFDATLIRGFDYYTGVVFEIFDTDPTNAKAMLGGGRYDRLLEIFEQDPLPAVGFGMSDVRIQNFLEAHGLVSNIGTATDLYLVAIDAESLHYAQDLAQKLRADGLNIEVDSTLRKVGDQIKTADKKGVPMIAVIGEKERSSNQLILKILSSGETHETSTDDLSATVLKLRV